MELGDFKEMSIEELVEFIRSNINSNDPAVLGEVRDANSRLDYLNRVKMASLPRQMSRNIDSNAGDSDVDITKGLTQLPNGTYTNGRDIFTLTLDNGHPRLTIEQ